MYIYSIRIAFQEQKRALVMKIISYRPRDDQFWIDCTMEEAEQFFIPLLEDWRKDRLPNYFREYEEQFSSPAYQKIVCETMEIKEMSYIYFNVSRDLKICYYDVPHHPFHQLWNAYSPFRKCDIIEISHPSELKAIRPTYKGEELTNV